MNISLNWQYFRFVFFLQKNPSLLGQIQHTIIESCQPNSNVLIENIELLALPFAQNNVTYLRCSVGIIGQNIKSDPALNNALSKQLQTLDRAISDLEKCEGIS